MNTVDTSDQCNIQRIVSSDMCCLVGSPEIVDMDGYVGLFWHGYVL